MSKRHPVVAVTGSSGAGTSTVKRAFEYIFIREGIQPAVVEGDSYHRYERTEMKQAMEKALSIGNNFSHFGPEANLFDKLEELFKVYGETGGGEKRYYLHSLDEAADHNARLSTNLKPGQFTPWEAISKNTDLLFYEGLHGGVESKNHDVSNYVDLLVGVVPITNLEWIQKIQRDNAERGYSAEAIVDTILRRMPDYINYICPQFSRTDINFQRVPTVDTSNPFICRNIPTPDESFIIVHFRKGAREKWGIDFPYLLEMIHDSFMSSPTSIVINGGKMGFAMELILAPIIHRMIEEKKRQF
uniref:Phosphoribulokinase n=1 Tax=Paulinella chromatophora TaxID=39717 RepID=B1X3P2_PAUCH|nr:Phosphoribulokinase [Paulinella chromatophora]ACB42561.1 Phosphoribulokinase [Paulinella chromatophora]|eukprot:gb/GEZN01002165.1/.p1 GENE.gb/GEZN01002165.1/~~gb/GEZN01002165.1/.p1  ORF type:complete len:301 (-),score=6.47 gb/GEZN01002165.1/:1186-2088(-)